MTWESEQKLERREEDRGQATHSIRPMQSTTSFQPRLQWPVPYQLPPTLCWPDPKCAWGFPGSWGDHWQSYGTTQKCQGVIIPRTTLKHWQMKVNGWMLLSFVSGGWFWNALLTAPQKFPRGLTTVVHSGGQIAHFLSSFLDPLTFPNLCLMLLGVTL